MKKIICLIFLLLFPINIYAYSAVVMDIDSGRVLYNSDGEYRQVIASITKIMTAIVVLENAQLDKKVIVGDEITSMYGTNIYLEVGEEITIKDLLYGMMLRSGNDAAMTLAVNTFDNTDMFINKMNEKAKELGMVNTNFENPHGLDDSTKNYSTAYDMALLSRYAYKNKIYKEIISTKKYITKSSKKSYVWYNRMSLLNNYKYCIGGKNGYTPKAGKTLVSLAKKDGMTFTIVTLDDSDIYNNHKELYEIYFNKYKQYLIIDKDNFFIDSFDDREFYLKKSFKYVLNDSDVNNIKTLVSFYDNNRKYVAGEISIFLKNKKIGSLDIYVKENKKEEKRFFQKIKELIIR